MVKSLHSDFIRMLIYIKEIVEQIFFTLAGSSKDDVGGSMVSCPYTIDLDCEDSEGSDIGSSSEFKKLSHGSSRTVVDLVAEEFGLVLEESRLSTSNALPISRNEDKCRWCQWRTELDKRISKLLRYKHYMRTIQFSATYL